METKDTQGKPTSGSPVAPEPAKRPWLTKAAMAAQLIAGVLRAAYELHRILVNWF